MKRGDKCFIVCSYPRDGIKDYMKGSYFIKEGVYKGWCMESNEDYVAVQFGERIMYFDIDVICKTKKDAIKSLLSIIYNDLDNARRMLNECDD